MKQTCPFCGGRVTLTSKGKIRSHGDRWEHTRVRCLATGLSLQGAADYLRKVKHTEPAR